MYFTRSLYMICRCSSLLLYTFFVGRVTFSSVLTLSISIYLYASYQIYISIQQVEYASYLQHNIHGNERKSTNASE